MEVKEVVYCGVCGLPPEYCSYGSGKEKCREWLCDTHTALYEALYEQQQGAEKDDTTAFGSVQGGEEDGAIVAGPSPSEEKKSGKAHKQAPHRVVVTTTQRSKRKFVTNVQGLDKFGVKLEDAARQFARKFACGSSVVKRDDGGEEVDVQGDVKFELIEFITDRWDLPEEFIVAGEDKKGKRRHH